MIEGNFIVIEGIDGAGTSTQAVEMKKRFSGLGLPAHVTAEPSSGPIGSIIRQILTGRIVVPQHHGVSPPSWTTMSLLFAADRQDHVESEVVPNLRDGVNIICDRYIYSSIVYQSASSEDSESREWIRMINRYARKPDLVVYLKVSPDIAVRRRRERDRHIEIYDSPEFQQRLAVAYDKIEEQFPDVNIVRVNGDHSVEEVAEKCWFHIEKMRAGGAPA
ncbi:MAG: dTMP kinase [Deltaproteobacteria bacterium]|nr:dTMP kinase [Deltaproteobacteria bacterium]